MQESRDDIYAQRAQEAVCVQELFLSKVRVDQGEAEDYGSAGDVCVFPFLSWMVVILNFCVMRKLRDLIIFHKFWEHIHLTFNEDEDLLNQYTYISRYTLLFLFKDIKTEQSILYR